MVHLSDSDQVRTVAEDADSRLQGTLAALRRSA